MWRFIVQRLMQGVVLVLLVTTIVFFLGRLTGNPADIIENAFKGDLGLSVRYRQPAVDIFFSRLPNTLKIVPAAMAIAILMAIPLGILSALRRGSITDRVSGSIAVLGIATPNFWLGILLIYIFSVTLGWLPSARMGGFSHYILPTITLGTFLVAGFMRLIRSSMLEILDSEFVKLARIKGLSEWIVVWKHCLRNALIPVLTLWGVFMGGLVTGAIVTETVFAWPGIGRLTYEAVIFRDFPLLQAVIIMDAILVLFINLLVDILYAYIDPRIRYS